MRVTIVCGTNRENSISSRVSNIYQGLLTKAHIDSEIINLYHLPEKFTRTALYENAGKDEAFNVFSKKMWDSDKYVFVVPEYNGSFPGVLKAFIDGLKYPGTFKGKKCALVGLSAGTQGGGLAISHLTDIFNYMGMHVLAEKPKLAKIDSYLKNGTIDNPLYLDLLQAQINAFKIF